MVLLHGSARHDARASSAGLIGKVACDSPMSLNHGRRARLGTTPTSRTLASVADRGELGSLHTTWGKLLPAWAEAAHDPRTRRGDPRGVDTRPDDRARSGWCRPRAPHHVHPTPRISCEAVPPS